MQAYAAKDFLTLDEDRVTIGKRTFQPALLHFYDPYRGRHMTIELTPEQSKAIQVLVEAGTFRNEAHAIGEAIRLLKEKEELKTRVNAGVRQLDEGHYRTYRTDERDRFISDIEAAAQTNRTASRKDSA
jgi:Arc/MetJ-type ribon-helix-helix transcriptional regulator